MAATAATALCLLAAATGCSSSNIPAQARTVRETGTVTLQAKCTATRCSGTRDGGKFSIQLPTTAWNGTLLIWSHAYRNAVPIPANPLNPSGGTVAVDRSAQLAPSPTVAQDLRKKGYALAGSAFATNGWDVPDGVRADRDLYNYFSKTFGTPNRVYLWGNSTGGLISQTLAEQHPEWVSAVAPMCAPLSGTNMTFDLALDVAYAVKTLIDPKLQLTGFSSAQAAVRQWERATQTLVKVASRGDTKDVANLFAIAAIGGLPTKTDMFDGRNVTAQVEAIVQSIVLTLATSTYQRYDIEQRVGGNPSQNTGVDYGKRIGTTYDFIIGNQKRRIAQALAAGTRVSADPTARAAADRLGDPTGSVQRPTITLHTEFDPQMIVQNERVFAERAQQQSGAGLLVQLFTGPPAKYSQAPYGAGNCNFTDTEYEAVVNLLDKWVRLGVYPGPLGVADALSYSIDVTAPSGNNPTTIKNGTATTGYDANFAPASWPGSS
ncbi:MAG TPA: hypothetical protein VFH38_02025 [Jatrophihabitans sp.]|nr:hypothetical protein [Jatrophihabitans sp.]